MLTRPSVALRRVRLLPRWIRRIDSRVARSVNRRHGWDALDRALARLSHSADRSRLWIWIAVLLHLIGGRSRRGAARGVVSLLGASILANLVGKRVFGGDRPLLRDVPVPRRLDRTPTSGSFPSGHSASAAAFVTGVLLESPRAGAALAPVAGAVAYSRLHTGAHWLSDVVGGVALGSAVALLGRMLVPAPSETEPAHEGPAVDLPALEDGKGALIIVNADSGVDPFRPEPVGYLSETLPAARVHVLQPGERVEQIVQDAMASAQAPQVLGVWGGDGTVSATADAARRAGLPLLVPPGGTFNHFARTAGAATLEDAITAVRTGTGKRVDVAELVIEADPAGSESASETATVLNVASVGVYPEFVAVREEIQPSLGKPIASVIAAVRVLARAQRIEAQVDGRRATVWSIAVAAGRNSSASMVPLQRRRLDDGVLDVRVLHARGRMPRVRGLVALAFGLRASSWLDRFPGRASLATIESFTAEQVRIQARSTVGESVGIAHDGEVSTAAGADRSAAATVRIVPAGLDVYGLDLRDHSL